MVATEIGGCKTWLYAGTPVYPTVLVPVTPLSYGAGMNSDKPIGAGNQQETEGPEAPLDPWWLVGFVDGEGCFSVAIHKNPHVRRTRGWQLTPVFQVYQHEKEHELLERVRRFFGTGRIVSKGPNSNVLTYTVSSMRELAESIIPFFGEHRPLVKGPDFDRFAEIVRSMQAKEHLEPDGFERCVRLAYEMNAHGKQRTRTLEEVLQGSSETVRQAPR